MAKKKTLPPPPQVEQTEILTWTIEPIEGELATAKVHAWETTDEKYQVKRMESIGMTFPVFGAQYKRGWSWDIFEHDHKQGPGYPKYYKSLEEALVSVEIFHLKRTGRDTVKTNIEDVLSQAHRMGLDGHKKAVKVLPPPGEEGSTDRPRPVRRSEGKMTCLDAAYQVLLENGGEMDLKEMIVEMERKGYWSSPGGATPWATLGSAIGVAQRTKNDTRFRKMGRGKFAANH